MINVSKRQILLGKVDPCANCGERVMPDSMFAQNVNRCMVERVNEESRFQLRQKLLSVNYMLRH